MRVVETKEYLDVLSKIIEEGKEVNLPVAGGSMNPFLVGGRDTVRLAPLKENPVKGDIVLFRRETGDYVLHRVCKAENGKYYMIGDAQVRVEGPIRQDQLVAAVPKACRKGKWVGPGTFWWSFFRHVWMWMIPVRRLVIGIYVRI